MNRTFTRGEARQDWHDIKDEVVQPLSNEGAEFNCQVVIVAQGDAAIRDDTFDLGTREPSGLRCIGAGIQQDERGKTE